MKFEFVIIGEAEGGDALDVKAWLEESINEYNKDPKVIEKFTISVQEAAI